MKLENIGETVEGTITALQTEGFKIANTAHMMEILSKRLYSNPELAVCRELVCNAIDAHVAAHNNQPVEVTLPDWTNDFRFVVKDFGTGLSEEEVMNLYTTYGASTKQSSNDFIGCLGIGSKSPFAVTEEFSVVSRYNGFATSYHCYKQNGMPVCTKLSQIATDEHNGMTITVPFKGSSVSHFISSSIEFFKGVNKELVKVFSPSPLQFFEDCKTRASFTGSAGSVYVSEDHWQDDYIRMGQVRYKIPSQWVRDSLLTANYAMTLDVPIGTFTIAASRENIEENVTNHDRFLHIVQILQHEYFEKSLLPQLQRAKTYHTYKTLRSNSEMFDFNKEIEQVYANSPLCLDISVGYVKSWFKQHKRWSCKPDVYSRRDDACCVIADEEPVVSVGLLLKKWHTSDKLQEYVMLSPGQKTRFTPAKIIPAYTFSQVVYVSQLNKWYNYLQSQAKRRRKTAQKAVRSDVFSVYRLLHGEVDNRRRKTSDTLNDVAVVPYIVLKELKPVDEEDIDRVKLMDCYDEPCYGIAQVNVRGLPDKFVPLKEYLEEHKQDFEDRDYHKRKRECLMYLQTSQRERRYTNTSYKEFLGKDAWLYEFRCGFTPYEPKTLGDRLALKLLQKYKNYQKFLTSVSGWFNMYGYKEAPDEVKAYVRKLFEDMVESSQSSAE